MTPKRKIYLSNTNLLSTHYKNTHIGFYSIHLSIKYIYERSIMKNYESSLY